MEILAIVLRILHIFAGVVWVGFGLFMLSLIRPTESNVADAGLAIRRIFKYMPINRIFPVAAVTTTLSGLLLYVGLYLLPSGEINSTILQTSSGLVLTIGSIFGLLAFGHGIGLGRLTERYAKNWEGAGDTPTESQLEGLQEMHGRLTRSTTVSMVLAIIALLGMSIFSYL